MIRFSRKPPQLHPFTITALRHDEPPIRIGLMARTTSDAMLTAQELFPSHVIGIAALEPEWQEDPA
jgi:hypothetical protein